MKFWDWVLEKWYVIVVIIFLSFVFGGVYGHSTHKANVLFNEFEFLAGKWDEDIDFFVNALEEDESKRLGLFVITEKNMYSVKIHDPNLSFFFGIYDQQKKEFLAKYGFEEKK